MTVVRELHCGACGEGYSVARVLATAEVSWPNQGWLYFTCAKCAASWHVEVSKGRIAIGELDGAPGPCFFAREKVSVPGLIVQVSERGISVRLDGKTTFVRAKA